MNIGRDEVLQVKVLLFFGQIRPEADPGRGKIICRSGTLFICSSDWKAITTNWMHSNDLEAGGCYFFVPFRFDDFLDLVL